MKSTQEEMKKGYKAAARRKRLMQKWYVVKNGEIIYTGTEKECGKIIEEDMSGKLEMYPEEARQKTEPTMWDEQQEHIEKMKMFMLYGIK